MDIYGSLPQPAPFFQAVRSLAGKNGPAAPDGPDAPRDRYVGAASPSSGATAAAGATDTVAPPGGFFRRADSPEARLYGASGSTWLTGGPHDVETLSRTLDEAKKQGTLPVITQYAIPGRDKSGGSSGGFKTPEAYFAAVEANARAIGDAPALVVIEPDALALGLDPAIVKGAVERYRRTCPNAKIYIDAGHVGWHSPGDMAAKLVSAGVAKADGFSLNVSNFEWTSANMAWGDRAVAALGQLDPALSGKQFVIDTSRNGAGPGVDEHGFRTWGDPVAAKGGGPITNGPLPTTHTGDVHCAAFVWVKPPGYGDYRTRPADAFGGKAWVTPNAHPLLGPPSK